MNKQATTTNSSARARLLKSAFTALLPAFVLLLSAQTGRAASTSWVGGNNTMGDPNDWNNFMNWARSGLCGGGQCVPDDIATFVTSNFTAVSVTQPSVINEIKFNPGANSFTISVVAQNPAFEILGAGVINNSGITQTFVSPPAGGNESISFYNSATAGTQTVYNIGESVDFNNTATADHASFVLSGAGGAGILFLNSSTADHASFISDGVGLGSDIEFFDTTAAANATFVLNGRMESTTDGDGLSFSGSATADHAIFTINGGVANGAPGATIYFSDTSTAASSLITINGGTITGASGSLLEFTAGGVASTPSAGNATLIVNGGTNGGGGGAAKIFAGSAGGTARIEIFGDGSMDISAHVIPGVTIGSIEGTGMIFLGGAANLANNLTVGTNNLSTTFSGIIQDGGEVGGVGGSLTKIGRGTLTLSGVNTYTGATTVSAGTLLVNQPSTSRSGSVKVNVGTLGGSGTVNGALTIGKGSGSGAFLAPGAGAPGTLACKKSLTFKLGGTYNFELNSSTAAADSVTAKGVTINSGALFSFIALGSGAIPPGTVFTVINNTATTAISGRFSNLADGSTFIAGSNTYLVNYEGGAGNDLTLTVQ